MHGYTRLFAYMKCQNFQCKFLITRDRDIYIEMRQDHDMTRVITREKTCHLHEAWSWLLHNIDSRQKSLHGKP